MSNVDELVGEVQVAVFDNTGLMMTDREARIAARATLAHILANHSAYGRTEDLALDALLKQLED